MENINSVNQEQGSTRETIQSYCKKPDIRILILLEDEEQVKDCAKWLKEIKGQKQVIALSPFAVYEMDGQNIPYRIPEDYYDPGELYQLGMDNYQKVEELCGIVDSSIQTASSITAKLGIKPALFSFFHLKILYDAMTIRLFQLFKLVNAENPNVIFIYGSESYPFGVSEKAPFLFFDNRESIYAHLLALAGWKVPVVVLPPVQQPEKAYVQRRAYQDISNKFKRKTVRWLQLHPQLYNLAVAIRNREWRGLFDRLKGYLHANKDIPVLLLGAYSWDDSREVLQSAGIGPIFRMQDDLGYWLNKPICDKVDSEELINGWEGLRANGEFREFFIWDNIDFFPVMEERLRFLVECLTPVCLKAYEEAAGLLERREIKALLAAVFSTCTSCSVAQAARGLAIPVITWQHGSYGYMDLPMMAYNDLRSSDIHFAFGEGVVEKHRTIAEKLGTQIIPIGSSSLDRLHKKVVTKDGRFLELDPNNKKTVLYITTNFCQNNCYISFPPPFSDNLLWQTQRTIADVLRRHNEYNVIIKTHPALSYRETPLPAYARDSGFQNCQCIRNERPFTDLLPIADIIVIDFPSTTLLQSLVMEKPIFAYFGHLCIDSKAKKLLERRAYCFNELNDFIYNLDVFLSDGVIDIKVDLNDKVFLEKYGIYKSDGKSGERAAQTIKSILGRDRGQY